MSAKQKPTGFIATCQCGQVTGALDYERTDRKDSGRMLSQWLASGKIVSPMFDSVWSVDVAPCECGKKGEHNEVIRPARLNTNKPDIRQAMLEIKSSASLLVEIAGYDARSFQSPSTVIERLLNHRVTVARLNQASSNLQKLIDGEINKPGKEE